VQVDRCQQLEIEPDHAEISAEPEIPRQPRSPGRTMAAMLSARIGADHVGSTETGLA
jgi:hypothetical protein